MLICVEVMIALFVIDALWHLKHYLLTNVFLRYYLDNLCNRNAIFANLRSEPLQKQVRPLNIFTQQQT